MITVKELAKICGVSPSTVSNILNDRPNVGEETRKRVMEVAKEAGYQPNFSASGIRKRRSRVISIIAEDLGQFTTPAIVGAAMAYCESKGYRTILINLRMYERWSDIWYRDEGKLAGVLYPALQEIRSIKVDGMIYVAGHSRILSCFPAQYDIPTVVAYAASDGDRFPSVMLDDEKAGYDMGKCLISMGHTRIAVIAGEDKNIHTRKRLKGYGKALKEAGIDYAPEFILSGSWMEESGYELAPQVFEREATAVWCMNDQMAGGFYRYLFEKGLRAGEDISVAGFDRMNISNYMTPRLTTVELLLRQIGHQAAVTMLNIVDNNGWKPEEMKQWIPGKLLIRESVRSLTDSVRA